MGLGKLFGGAQERAIGSVPWTQAFDKGADLFGTGTRSWAGKDVSAASSMQLLAVYGAVNFITSHAETFPRDTYRQIGTKSPENVANQPWLDQLQLGSLVYSYLLDGNAMAIPVRDESVHTVSPRMAQSIGNGNGTIRFASREFSARTTL